MFSLITKIGRATRIIRPGRYILTEDIVVESGTAIRVDSSRVTIDLNGKTIRCTGPSTKEDPTFGILAFSAQRVAISNGTVTGFRFGIHSKAKSTHVRGMNLSENTYCGCHLGGDQSIFQNNIVRDIGGVDDEAYAVGVNLTEGRMVVENNFFQNIYRQQSAAPDAAGQGCAIIINRTADNSLAKRNYITNDESRPGTIGIFAGDGADQTITCNTIRGFHWGVGMTATGWLVSITENDILLDVATPGSRGISAFRGLAQANRIVGYETPIFGSIEKRDNRIASRVRESVD